MTLLVVLGAAAVAWWRLPAIARDTLWAEDGRTFLSPAAGPSPWATLVTPYAGYLHTIPRLEALLIAHLVPVAGWALAMTGVNCILAGGIAGIVFISSERIVTWVPARVVLASLTVMTPLASREVLGNAANFHSLVLWGLFWVMLAMPRSRSWSAAMSMVTLLGALTEIQVVFLLPLIAIRFRDRRTWAIKAALLVGAALQLVATVVSPRSVSGAAPDSAPSIAFGWVINAVLTSWLPRSWIAPTVAALGPMVIAILIVPAASLVVELRYGEHVARTTALLLLAGSVTIWVVSVSLDPAPFYEYASPSVASSGSIWLSRYGVVPAMMLLGITAIAVSVLFARRRPGPVRLASVIAVALAVVLVVQAPTTDTRRSGGPEWSTQIAGATAACRSGVPTIHLRETLGWTVAVPCEDLTR